MVLPHSLMKFLLSGVSEDLLEHVVGSGDSIAEFWEFLTNAQYNPCTHTRCKDKMKTVIPIGLHGDEFRFTQNGEKILAVSLNFVLGHRRARYPLFLLRSVSERRSNIASFSRFVMLLGK